MGDAVASDNRDHTAELGGPFHCITSFARDAAGELYFMDFDGNNPVGTGRVFALEVGPGTWPPARRPTCGANVAGQQRDADLGRAGQRRRADRLRRCRPGYTPGGVEIGAIPAALDRAVVRRRARRPVLRAGAGA